ncbi:progestin and adipoQ receptor family member 3 [Galleria mellonella]|uniref:Progestin and adipoQ receptor family member 3 n=1 Tax=Galleria mellonella TaxID=7137 RepID=A0A6J1WL41_GALME|nr:progestin and adipoQ receptor family member 3 [Galleria mellonella]XP_052756048.1 progestin and adipoQ receptor family member 3 [Galleria mellonella]
MTLTMTKKVIECQAETLQFMPIEKVEDECSTENYSSGSTLLKRGKKLEDNNNLTKEDLEYINYRQLLKYEEAPAYLQHNPYIRDGYRKMLPTRLCWESVFWWTNETMNIWTHVFGFFLIMSLTINDLLLINIHATMADKVVAAVLFSCFMICMALSALYHTFSCRSETDYNTFLMYDLFGIALSLLAIYTSGVYYAFWCNYELKVFYMITVTVIFVVAMTLQIPRLNVSYLVKMCVFIGWAAYGMLPTLHWTYINGGFDNPLVQILVPRIVGMYLISGTAFIIYAFKIPEIWFPGKVDYIGHSHQWWHILVLGALYYWHNTAMLYVQYRMNHGCASTMRIF